VTMDGFWTGNRIIWTLWYNEWLHFTVHCYTHTHTHTVVSTVTSLLPLLGSGFQRRTFTSLWVPELSPASATSFSQQQLTKIERQQSSNSPNNYSSLHSTHSTDSTSLSVLLITSRHGPHRKLRSSVAVFNCFRGNTHVCEAVTFQRLLYICLSRGHWPATLLPP
jgi:hypothetical protein